MDKVADAVGLSRPTLTKAQHIVTLVRGRSLSDCRAAQAAYNLDVAGCGLASPASFHALPCEGPAHQMTCREVDR